MSKTSIFLIFFLLLGFQPLLGQSPNIIFVICDDLNFGPFGFGNHPQAHTPSLDAFQKESVSFSRAYCNSPICGPSRTSLISGVYPHTSGFYGYHQKVNKWNTNPIILSNPTVHQHFRDNGYEVYMCGKIHHLEPGLSEIDSLGVYPEHGPLPWDGVSDDGRVELPSQVPGIKIKYGSLDDVPSIPPDPPNGIPGYHGWTNRDFSHFMYNSMTDRDLMVDEKSVDWSLAFLGDSREAPFFLSLGFMRPHAPFIVPQEFFDLYDPDTLDLSPRMSWDTDDLSSGMVHNSPGYLHGRNIFDNLVELDEGGKKYLRECTHAYLASVSFVDYQFGRLFEGLKNSSHAENTVLIFTSDHGMQMAEKNQIGHKATLFGESSRIPLLAWGNNFPADQSCDRPVSLIDIYPSLVDIAGIPDPGHLEGHTLLPLINNPDQGAWQGPNVALTAQYSSELDLPDGLWHDPSWQHFAVTSKDFRYILTSHNEEELYNITEDPFEWFNLSGDSALNAVKQDLKSSLLALVPGRNVPEPDNIIYNGNFEHHLTGWNPSISGSADGIFQIDSADRVQGKMSLLFKLDSIDQPFNQQVLNSNFKIESGKEYTFSFWAKSKAEHATARVFIKSISQGPYIFVEDYALDTIWKKHEATFSSAFTSLTDIRLSFQWLEPTEYHLDNVLLRETKQGPQFCQGDFEQGWGEWKTVSQNGAIVHFGLDSLVPLEGAITSQIQVGSLGPNPANQQINAVISSFSCLDTILKGENYRISFIAKSSDPQQKVKLLLSTPPPVTNLLNLNFSLDSSSTIFSHIWQADSSYSPENLILKFFLLDTGTYYLDSVSMRNVWDCNGDSLGMASLDPCGNCSGGNTGLAPCTSDCVGIWGGTAYSDSCGRCVGGNTGMEECMKDCNGLWFGSAYIDSCNQCVRGNTDLNPCKLDCNWEWGGLAIMDSCGICAGGNTGISPLLDTMLCRVSMIPETQNNGLNIFPNPATNSIWLQGPIGTYFIYSILGKEIDTIVLNEQHEGVVPINISTYSSGIYFLRAPGKEDLVISFVKL